MKSILIIFHSVLLLFLLPPMSISQTSLGLPEKPKEKMVDLLGDATGSIEDISWIQGSWKGEAFGGEVEEIWSAPAAGSMMGMFRLIDNDHPSFYEIMIIREVEKSLVLQLKHFHHNLKGWEEKDETVDFPLVKVDKDKVIFEGIYFKKISEDQITVNVIIDEEKPEGVDFVYYRQKDI